MEKENIVLIDECCSYYNIEISFISSLQEHGLIHIETIEDKLFVHLDQLSELEKFIRLHYDLDINLEGLEAISHMLDRMRVMKEEIRELQARLKVYEESIVDSR